MSQKYQAFDEREREKHGKNCSLLGRNLSSAPVSDIIFVNIVNSQVYFVCPCCKSLYSYIYICVFVFDMNISDISCNKKFTITNPYK